MVALQQLLPWGILSLCVMCGLLCWCQGVFVEGLSEWVVRSPQEIYGLMERGGAMRATGSTKMNEMSSRSHAVFIIIAEQVSLPACLFLRGIRSAPRIQKRCRGNSRPYSLEEGQVSDRPPPPVKASDCKAGTAELGPAPLNC